MSDLKSMIKAVAEAHNAKNPGRRISITDPMTREQSEERQEKRRQQEAVEAKERAKKDAADLPNLENRHAEMAKTYEGGKNYRYADREQNLSDYERKARDIEPEMNKLGARISAAKAGGYKQGGKIDLKHCKISTVEKSHKHKDW